MLIVPYYSGAVELKEKRWTRNPKASSEGFPVFKAIDKDRIQLMQLQAGGASRC